MRSLCNFLLPFLFIFFLRTLDSSPAIKQQVYIVYFGEHSGEKTAQEIEDSHHSLLLSVKTSKEEARGSLLYSYKNSVNGFAAVLSSDEAGALSEMEDVVSVFPSRENAWSLQTTRSWEFIGELERASERMNSDLLTRGKKGKDVIIGLLDSGIWPESRSFSDEGMEAVPTRWKGICQAGDAFNASHCNRKLIGARFYIKAYEAFYGRLNTTAEYLSPRDHDGHGSHTASTAGGRKVRSVASLGGFGYGVASGGAPLARLAMYKVCWPIPKGDPALGDSCLEADMLSAIDDALGDGVDVLGISIGTSGKPFNYNQDGIAIGALHAVKKNVVVVCSAGNSGPAASTVTNLAPWILTVGASSLDRKFAQTVILGDGTKIEGQSVTPYKLEDRFYPLVYAGNAVVPGTALNVTTRGQCLPGSLNPQKVMGKIVLCLRGGGARVSKGMEVKRAGGAAIVLGNLPVNGDEIPADANVLPGTTVASGTATRILAYLNSSRSPVAKILPVETVLNFRPSPSMAAFSSKGPNPLDASILKPDITAPGMNILAAWSGASAPTRLEGDPRRVEYNFMSGTSMSCPHVAAAAALLRAIHPRWTAAAIRSALMTTATVLNNEGKPLADCSNEVAGPFHYGSGHVRPHQASDPGLIYDADYTDYICYLSSLSYIFDHSINCSKNPKDLNHPSIAISSLNATVLIKRTVTNVGGRGPTTYTINVAPPPGVSVSVYPKHLKFNGEGERKSFNLKIEPMKGERSRRGKYVFGSYELRDGMHIVRSPIAVSLGN